MERKAYVDNIRWMTVLLVILYHVIYIFNSVGVISNFAVQGIRQFDCALYFVYPWFMSLLFVVAGMSAGYSLQKRTGKEFLRDRAKRLLLPSVAGIFLIGWFAGWVTDQYVDMFAGNGDAIPGFVKYFIYCFAGIGPLWFAHELFLASVVLLLIRVIDKQDKIGSFGAKAGYLAFVILAFFYWGSSGIGNTPLVEVYRNGFYIFSFLLGYYVFCHEEVLERLEKLRWGLGIAAVICGIWYVIYYYGENYTTREVLQHPFTNFYAWLMILAILSWARIRLDFTNAFSRYMTKANFGFYVLHYPLLCAVAYFGQRCLGLPIVWSYVWNLVMVMILLPVAYEGVRRIPVVRRLLLGV